MKKIYLVLLLFSIANNYSQNKNFFVEENLIKWRYVYNDSTDISLLKSKALLEFKTDSTGVIKKTNFNDNKLRRFVADFKIEKKDKKYRVTVFNFVDEIEEVMVATMNANRTYPIEYTFLKKDGTIKKSLALGFNWTETINPYLFSLFEIKEKKDKDW